jgi:hypothetical protein
MTNLVYFTVTQFGKIKPKKAKSLLDLKITLSNGDCFLEKCKAEEYITKYFPKACDS